MLMIVSGSQFMVLLTGIWTVEMIWMTKCPVGWQRASSICRQMLQSCLWTIGFCLKKKRALDLARWLSYWYHIDPAMKCFISSVYRDSAMPTLGQTFKFGTNVWEEDIALLKKSHYVLVTW